MNGCQRSTGSRQSSGRRRTGISRQRRPAGLLALLLCLSAGMAFGVSDWVTLEGCSLETWDGNDGDSFLVKCPDLKPEKDPLKVFRLYYVDTPESEESLPERLEVQREYWDLPNVQTVVKCGEKAKQFSKHFLAGRFEVHTRWEAALGRTKMGRHYAMLSADGTDLGYALVRNGLARVYGKGPDLAGIHGYHPTAANGWWEKLRQAEALAKREKKGCWAYSKTKGGASAEVDVEVEEDAPAVAGGRRPGVGGTIGALGAGRHATVGPVRAAPLPAFGGTPAASGPNPAARAVPLAPPPRAPAAAALPATYPQDVTVPDILYIYSLRAAASAPPVGRLRAGMTVRVLEDVGEGRVRVRFKVSTGEVYEGAARKADLGME